MKRNTRFLTHAAVIGAMYFTLTHLQNLLLPNSTSFAVQCRFSEALMILSFFTPAAIPGLTIGCLLFNLSFSGALPLDFLVGSLATLCSCGAMYLTRNWKFRGLPLVGMVMPALFNALFVGWELTVYLGDTGFTAAAFLLNSFYVALGELIVLLSLGLALYQSLSRQGIARQIFS